MGVQGEVLIVGGGVAGLATALQLGAAGRRVLVVDKAPLPRDKVCGEGVMPLGLASLRELGLEAADLPGAPFTGLEYRSRRRRVALDFPRSAQGRGVRRTTLIAALHAATARLPGVSHHTDAARELIWREGRIAGVQGLHDSYHAPVVLAADGVHSSLARRAGVALRPYGERMALRRHYRLATGVAVPRVVVGLFAPHDVYLTPVGEGTLLATTMTDRVGYRAVVGRYDAFLRESPCGDLFAGAEPVSPQLGWHHPLFVPHRFHVGGMLLLGDAGGGVDPCLGVGTSVALASARMAAGAVAGMLAEPLHHERWERQFDRQRRELFRHYAGLGRVMRAAVRGRASSELLLLGMQHWPGVAASLLEIVATGRPWREVNWPALLEPLRPEWRSRRADVPEQG
ncbi:MAG TPA: NAD(P)/FAD-dependent oxidoreductase [bacterium]|nr:NAD(P)/FAD-dependent oxidoreductase [bacterium]